ncbi:MAG: nuclear transport factor 2 family protein [Alphaproteobacteria bacterium]|nr:nuclear transport factor 2 family protein [Alphaproteobacteria bacterium]
MMGPNEKALRTAYAAYVRGEPDIAVFADDIVWTSVGAPNRMETAGEWRGTDGVLQYYAALGANWTLSGFEVEEVLTKDDRRFAVRINVTAQNQVTGKAVRFDKVDFVTMESAKITTYSEIFDTAPLIRAARPA